MPFFIGALEVTKGLITLSSLIVLVQLANNLFNPILQITQLLADHYSSEPIIEKINYLKSKSSNTASGIQLPKTDLLKNLVINLNKNICFSNGLRISLDKNYNFTLADKILVVGPSGSGKTTLLKSLCGKYGIYSKDICVTNKQENSNLSSLCMYVTSDNAIFPGTILENITLNNDVNIYKLKEIINTLGLKAMVKYSCKCKSINLLSSGEKQRIVIARALLLSNKYFLFDEITSAVDRGYTEKIRKLFFSLDGGFIEVAHKIGNNEKKKYDKVIVLRGKE